MRIRQWFGRRLRLFCGGVLNEENAQSSELSRSVSTRDKAVFRIIDHPCAVPTLAGASVVWARAQSPLAWPVSLTASGWLRDEKSSLESANGLGQYRAQNRGPWLQALWDIAPKWQTGLRLGPRWAPAAPRSTLPRCVWWHGQTGCRVANKV